MAEPLCELTAQNHLERGKPTQPRRRFEGQKAQAHRKESSIILNTIHGTGANMAITIPMPQTAVDTYPVILTKLTKCTTLKLDRDPTCGIASIEAHEVRQHLNRLQARDESERGDHLLRRVQEHANGHRQREGR